MKRYSCIRWCCPCCLRGEPDEKSPRVKVAYATSKSPNEPDENVNLLKPDDLPENTGQEEETAKASTENSSESSHSDKEDDENMEEFTDENGMRVRRVVTKTVTTTSTKTSSDDVEPKHLTLETLQKEKEQKGDDADENTEVVEYVDENGRRVRRIVKKRIVTTTTTVSSKNDGPSSVTTETKEFNSGEGHVPERLLINFGGGMPRPSEEHSKLQPDPKPPTVQDSSKSSHSDKEDNENMEEFTDENGMRVRRVVTKTVTTSSTKTSSDDVQPKHLTLETLQKEKEQKGDDTDENTEVVEYVDENGRRVRRIVKKRIVTTTTTSSSKNDGPSSVTTETKEFNSGGAHDPERLLINFGGGTPRPSEEHSKLKPDPKPPTVQEKEVFLQFGSQPPKKEESHMKVDIKGQPFQIHNIDMFSSKGHTTITNGSPAGNKTVYQRTVITKTIGGGDGETKVVEHSTTTSSHGGDHPVTAVTKERQINMPDWMEERSSPEKHKSHEMSDINVHLKYPSDYEPKKKDLESSANESRIHAQVAKRDKPVITMLSLDDVAKEKEKGEVKKPEKPEPPQASEDDNEEEEEDEEDDDGEIDEFEEEIVVMEVQRRPRFHKALERPQPEKEKTGIPIEDLLEIPTLEVGQESAPEDNLIDEQIESEDRPQTVYEAPDLEELLKDW